MCPGLICYVRQGQNKPLFVVAIDDREKALNTVDLVHKHFPHLKILARAIDRHAYELLRRGVEVCGKPGSAVEMGVEALKLSVLKAHRAARTFKSTMSKPCRR